MVMLTILFYEKGKALI